MAVGRVTHTRLPAPGVDGNAWQPPRMCPEASAGLTDTRGKMPMPWQPCHKKTLPLPDGKVVNAKSGFGQVLVRKALAQGQDLMRHAPDGGRLRHSLPLPPGAHRPADLLCRAVSRLPAPALSSFVAGMAVPHLSSPAPQPIEKTSCREIPGGWHELCSLLTSR